MAEPVSVEKQAVRLADVYSRAFAAVEATLPGRTWKPSDPANRRLVAHEIAMLLVQRVLSQETGPCQ